MRSLTSTSLLFLALTAGCGSGGTDPGPGGVPGDGQGTFTASVSGAVTSAPRGAAAFGTQGGTRFVLTLQTNTIESIQFVRAQAGLPAVGAYSIVAPSEATGPSITGGYATAANRAYVVQSGALTITSASANRLRGSFQFTATAQGDPNPVTVSGTFDAVGQ